MSIPPAAASDPIPPAGPPRPRQRWWTLSLRATMIAVLLIGAGLGWLARRAHLQRRGVAAITARGGRVAYDWGMSDAQGAPPAPGKEAPGPAWLRRWVGDEFFQEVASVTIDRPTAEDMAVLGGFDRLQELGVGDVAAVGDGFGRLAGIATLRKLRIGRFNSPNPGIDDATLAPVGRLTTLDGLQIQGASITDAGLGSLRDLTGLTILTLNSCPGVTSAGVARLLDHLPLLERLDLPSTPVGDPAMPAVGRLAHLELLNLTMTDVTDAGMADLARAPRLQILQIRSTALGDDGLAHLARVTTLQSLAAGATQITDAGLVHLGRMADLTNLELTGTAITDAGLAHLASLRKLRTLTVTTTAITDAGTPALGRLRGLLQLTLTQTKVTDAGLAPLADLKQLTTLAVQNTAVTAAGEAEFRRLLPTLANFRRGAYARPASARPVAARLGPGGSPPAQSLRPGSGTNRPDRPAQPPAAPSKGTAVGSTSEPQGTVLDRLKDKHRPILVFAPAGDDARAARQRNAWAGSLPEAGIKDRDIAVVEILGSEGKAGDQPVTPDEARELRQKFGVADDAFAVVLVGRDGTEKARWADPVSSQEVFGRIDAMPMRQQEVEQKGGH